MKHISIEGNIGVGKSTVLDYIDQIILDRGESVFVDEGHLSTIREPVEMWTRPVTDDGKSKLELLYEDPKNQTANFQRGVLEDLPRAIQQGYDCTLGSSSIVTERSVGSSLRVFSAVHLDPKYGNITSNEFIELLDYFIWVMRISICQTLWFTYVVLLSCAIKELRKGVDWVKQQSA